MSTATRNRIKSTALAALFLAVFILAGTLDTITTY